MSDFLTRLRAHRAGLDADYVAGIEAQRFVDMMEREHPAELAEWMRTHAVAFATSTLAKEERDERSRAIHRAGSRAFATAADQHEQGDSEALSLFRVRFVVDDQQTRRRLGDMTGRDCAFVADHYRADGVYKLKMESFFRVLERKAGRSRVGEVMNEQQVENTLRQFIGDEVLEGTG